MGQVGSGKSSLLSAMLGEMIRLNGCINTRGRIAYVPQQAWMQNATLKNNILFGRDYKKDLYEKVITFLFFFSNCVYIVWPLTFFEKASINQHLIKASFRTFSITNFSLDKKVCVQKTLRISFFSL